ncbi:MAG: GntR family transcriptional regulator [Oscillospiraceae bacterium]|nr:GntR family transcriptional regulator [Oscillospiraceae bacterium]
MIHLDHRDSRPIYEQIADAFRRQIETGVLTAGERLPSVRELSAMLTINPNTIQRAYRELENGGWIESAAGKGSFVAHRSGGADTARKLRSFDEAVRELLLQGVSPAELIDRIKQAGGADNA